MGYIFAHLYIGEEILKQVDYTTRSRRVFNFGTMGPDFLYAESVETEKQFHDDHAEDFVKYLLTHSNKKTLDYALGYASHIYADREMYPVIMKFARGNFEEYMRLSLLFDAMLAKKIYKVSIEKINIVSKIDVGKNLPEDIDALLKESAESVYNLSNLHFNDTYGKFIRFLALTYDPFLVKRTVYPIIKYIFKFDIYKLTYPVFIKNVPENFYEETNESLKRGIERSITSLSKLLK